MPIKDLPKSFRRLGKIRLGEQVPVMEGGKQKVSKTGNPVTRPAKLERFRLTSPDRMLLDHAAEVYGGEVREWAGAPGDGDQWELYVTQAALDVVIPPQLSTDDGDLDSGSFQQWYEMWSGGGCQRRCDGVIEQISGKACTAMKPACPVDHEARRAAAANGGACKMTTRLMVLLPQLPDLGVWMLESHGWYAAVELGGFMEFLARRAPGQFVNGKMEPEARQVKRGGKTHNFVVPVIKLPQGTAGELLAAAPVRELGTGTAGMVSDADRVRSFVIKVSDAGWDDDVRHAIVAYATKGRTRSSREVGTDEWPAAEAVLRWLNEEKLVIRGDGDETYLAKPVAAAGAVVSDGGRVVAAQSRELPDEPEFDVDPPDDEPATDQAPVEDPADDWDRKELMTRLDALDDEHREVAKAAWMEQSIAPPNSDRLTKDHVEAAQKLLLAVEEQAKTAYKNRLRMLRAVAKSAGVTTEAAQIELVKEATGGRTDSLTRLSADDVQAVAELCQRMLDEEAAGEADATTAVAS